jgi:hypothetical protein
MGIDGEKLLGTPAIGHAATAEAPFARQLLHDTLRLGDLAVEWAENSAFLDSSGKPAILSLDGRGATFSSLCRKYFGDQPVQSIVSLGIETKMLERVDTDKVALVSSCLMLTGQSTLMLARAVLCVRGLLEGMVNNAKAGASAVLWPDRLACSYVKRADFDKFAAAMRPQLHDVVDQGNRWLSEHTVQNASAARDDRLALMGVHAYVFTDN